MIINEREYIDWIVSRGVGENDRVASSPASYLSYLNKVSVLLGTDITPDILASEDDVLVIAKRINGTRAAATINNNKSAMRHYVAMVRAVRSPEAAPSVPAMSALHRPATTGAASEHSLFSRYRESLLEHLLCGEIMRHLWLRGFARVEMLKPQVDDAGYDLVLEANRVVRHVQLKSSHIGSSTSDAKVGLALASKPSGCVVWLWFDPANLNIEHFLWFGAAPGAPLPDISRFKVAKHTKGNAQGVKLDRPNVRVVPKNTFERIPSVSELIERLFVAQKKSDSGLT
jgi:hypothetical protein